MPQLPSENDMLKYPLLSDLFSIDQLDMHGEVIARQHEIDRRPAFEKLLGRLTKNEKVLREICHDLTKREAAKHTLFPAGVWLLDNFYLIK